MTPAIEVIMYCSQSGFSASKPKTPAQNLNFQLTPRAEKQDSEEQRLIDAIFADPNVRGASLNLQGVSPEVAAQFSGAPRVRITVEILAD